MNMWHQLVENSATTEGVVAVARDYLSSLTPDDLGPVPLDCRPGRLRDESDIDFWNVRLADECRAVWGTNRDGRTLTELSQFFMRASVRISRVACEPRVTPLTHAEERGRVR